MYLTADGARNQGISTGLTLSRTNFVNTMISIAPSVMPTIPTRGWERVSTSRASALGGRQTRRIGAAPGRDWEAPATSTGKGEVSTAGSVDEQTKTMTILLTDAASASAGRLADTASCERSCKILTVVLNPIVTCWNISGIEGGRVRSC